MFHSKTAEYGCSDAAEVTLQIPSDALLLGLIAGNFGLSARSAAESTSPAFPLQALPSQRNLLACPYTPVQSETNESGRPWTNRHATSTDFPSASDQPFGGLSYMIAGFRPATARGGPSIVLYRIRTGRSRRIIMQTAHLAAYVATSESITLDVIMRQAGHEPGLKASGAHPWMWKGPQPLHSPEPDQRHHGNGACPGSGGGKGRRGRSSQCGLGRYAGIHWAHSMALG